jgi:hypothetical protein
VILHGHCIALHTEKEYESAVDNWQDIKTIRARAGANA